MSQDPNGLSHSISWMWLVVVLLVVGLVIYCLAGYFAVKVKK
jgi:heme/copper-type cytochrome/quinol oxidase subunit 2